MAGYEFHIENDNTKQIIQAADEAIERALEEIGQQAVAYAFLLCPADTSNLRNSITHQVVIDEKAVYIGTDVEYAPYVEYGTGIYADNGEGRKSPWWYQDEDGKWHYTHGQKPAHFIRDAIEKHIDDYKSIAEENLSR